MAAPGAPTTITNQLAAGTGPGFKPVIGDGESSKERSRSRDRERGRRPGFREVKADDRVSANRVQLSNVPTDKVTQRQIEEWFGKHGKVVGVSMAKNSCTVSFDKEEAAMACATAENGSLFHGNKLEAEVLKERDRGGDRHKDRSRRADSRGSHRSRDRDKDRDSDRRRDSRSPPSRRFRRSPPDRDFSRGNRGDRDFPMRGPPGGDRDFSQRSLLNERDFGRAPPNRDFQSRGPTLGDRGDREFPGRGPNSNDRALLGERDFSRDLQEGRNVSRGLLGEKEMPPRGLPGDREFPPRGPPGEREFPPRGPPGEREFPLRGPPGEREFPSRGPPGDREFPSRGPPGDREFPPRGPPGDREFPPRGPPGDREFPPRGPAGDRDVPPRGLLPGDRDFPSRGPPGERDAPPRGPPPNRDFPPRGRPPGDRDFSHRGPPGEMPLPRGPPPSDKEFALRGPPDRNRDFSSRRGFDREGGTQDDYQNRFPPPVHPSERAYDAAVIAATTDVIPYAESLERRLNRSMLTSNLIVLKHDSLVHSCMDDLLRKGILYAILVTRQHEQHLSCTMRIICGDQPTEHRNMPVDDALSLVNRHFEAFLHELKERAPPPNPDPSRLPVGFFPPSARLMHLLHLLADSRVLTVQELVEVEEFVRQRKDRLQSLERRAEGGASKTSAPASRQSGFSEATLGGGQFSSSARGSAAPPASSGAKDEKAILMQQQELQAKILSILNPSASGKPGAAEATTTKQSPMQSAPSSGRPTSGAPGSGAEGSNMSQIQRALDTLFSAGGVGQQVQQQQQMQQQQTSGDFGQFGGGYQNPGMESQQPTGAGWPQQQQQPPPQQQAFGYEQQQFAPPGFNGYEQQQQPMPGGQQFGGPPPQGYYNQMSGGFPQRGGRGGGPPPRGAPMGMRGTPRYGGPTRGF